MFLLLEVDTKEQLYLLLFRGILFAFPVWSGSELVPGLSTQSPDLSELSTQRSFILSRVCIFSGNDSKEARCAVELFVCTVLHLQRISALPYLLAYFFDLDCLRLFCDIVPLRAPRLPLECFHGNCYCDSVALLRVGGAVTGLSLKLIADGRSTAHSELWLW